MLPALVAAAERNRMNRHVKTLALLVILSGFAFCQRPWREKPDQSWNPMTAGSLAAMASPGIRAQEQQPDTRQNEKHLSKKEKKELKKRRKEEEKQRKKEAKEQEKQLREQQKRKAKEDTKEQKRELKKQNQAMAREQDKEDKRERKEQKKEMKSAERKELRAEHGALMSAAKPRDDLYTIPVSREVAPGLLQAQRRVSRSIYSQIPHSHVIVLVNNANQIVLRGSAPTPSFKRRLLGLALSAAGGYGIVDQLAANMVGTAAGGVTSATIGGVSDLIHGSGSRRDNYGGYYDQQGPPFDNSPGAYGPPSPYGPPDRYGSPSRDNAYGPPGENTPNPNAPPPNGSSYTHTSASEQSASSKEGLTPGSNACVNLSGGREVLVTGQTASQVDKERLQQFAQLLGGTNATVIDQLATRTENVNPGAGTASYALMPETILDANALGGLVTPGSVVCVNVNNNSLLLTGTVGSTGELANVEHALQPLLGNEHLVDQLTTGTLTGSAAPQDNASSGGGAGVAESEVEQALHSIPRLSNIDATVSAISVRLSGSVETAEDEQVALGIARQYAPGRSIIDNMTVTHSETAPQ